MKTMREEWLKEIPDWSAIKGYYRKWYALMDEKVDFSLKDSQKHTKAHCMRVMLYAMIIANRLGLSEQEIDVLGIAAAFHDSRRQDDWLDVGHGQRASDYYREFCTTHMLKYDERAYFIMAYHDRDDQIGKEILRNTSLEDGELIYDIFKDADALDRFRLAANALDIEMLRTDKAKELVSFAKYLVQQSMSISPVKEPDKYLIVVDMQNDFVTGSLGSEKAMEISARAISKAEQYKGNVVFTLDSHPQNYLSTQEGRLLPVEHCITGTDGWQMISGMAQLQAKLLAAIYMKPTFGSTKLMQTLSEIHKQMPIREIELIGLCTDICVVSNALLLKAALPEVPIYVDADCCAGTTVDKHKAALEVMKSCQIRIVSGRGETICHSVNNATSVC